MKVLFKKLVVNVGHVGDVKDVKSGYALNCLIPQGLAVELTPALEKQLKQHTKKQEKHKRDLISDRHEMVEKLTGGVLDFSLKTGSNDKVFGAIGEKDIVTQIKKLYKINLTKKHIDLPDGHIKKLGENIFYVSLGKDAMAKMTAVIKAQ